ncbi:MAG: class I SAM-dependent RNA methyltransferase [Firmicutes bacterium]|nr:class I SAM-dependent RNA methyltransferase [Bacillota bacterium]
MYQNIKIEKLDHFGYGISFIDNKIVFIKDAIPGDIVDIKIINEKKKYSEAIVTKYIKKSSDRIESVCPYFNLCGGCNLLYYNYEKSIEFKLNKVKELLEKNKIKYNNEIEVIKNENSFNYRNKVTLKIIDGKIGYYEDSTHKLVEINECKVTNNEINKVIKNYKLLNLENASLTIRCNYNNEILLIINSSEDNYDIEISKLKEMIKLVGIIYNNKTIYGDNFFYERIGGYLFKVSYNSFFQVNPYICEKLFNLIKDNIDEDRTVLDLYSGVGTLGIVASSKACEVISVEIIKNAVVNGIFNAKLNKKNNIKFLLGDVSKIVEKINICFDTLIIDPPRSGLDKNTIKFIKEKIPSKLIYVSCDANTLMRDLKLLEDLYEIKTYKILDMFSYSYHLESFCVLVRK